MHSTGHLQARMLGQVRRLQSLVLEDFLVGGSIPISSPTNWGLSGCPFYQQPGVVLESFSTSCNVWWWRQPNWWNFQRDYQTDPFHIADIYPGRKKLMLYFKSFLRCSLSDWDAIGMHSLVGMAKNNYFKSELFSIFQFPLSSNCLCLPKSCYKSFDNCSHYMILFYYRS